MKRASMTWSGKFGVYCSVEKNRINFDELYLLSISSFKIWRHNLDPKVDHLTSSLLLTLGWTTKPTCMKRIQRPPSMILSLAMQSTPFPTTESHDQRSEETLSNHTTRWLAKLHADRILSQIFKDLAEEEDDISLPTTRKVSRTWTPPTDKTTILHASKWLRRKPTHPLRKPSLVSHPNFSLTTLGFRFLGFSRGNGLCGGFQFYFGPLGPYLAFWCPLHFRLLVVLGCAPLSLPSGWCFLSVPRRAL